MIGIIRGRSRNNTGELQNGIHSGTQNWSRGGPEAIRESSRRLLGHHLARGRGRYIFFSPLGHLLWPLGRPQVDFQAQTGSPKSTKNNIKSDQNRDPFLGPLRNGPGSVLTRFLLPKSLHFGRPNRFPNGPGTVFVTIPMKTPKPLFL